MVLVSKPIFCLYFLNLNDSPNIVMVGPMLQPMQNEKAPSAYKLFGKLSAWVHTMNRVRKVPPMVSTASCVVSYALLILAATAVITSIPPTSIKVLKKRTSFMLLPYRTKLLFWLLGVRQGIPRMLYASKILTKSKIYGPNACQNGWWLTWKHQTHWRVNYRVIT